MSLWLVGAEPSFSALGIARLLPSSYSSPSFVEFNATDMQPLTQQIQKGTQHWFLGIFFSEYLLCFWNSAPNWTRCPVTSNSSLHLLRSWKLRILDATIQKSLPGWKEGCCRLHFISIISVCTVLLCLLLYLWTSIFFGFFPHFYSS